MKLPLRLLMAFFCTGCLSARAQLFIGNAGNDLYIAAGSSVTYNGLNIAPSGAIVLSGTEINKGSTPVSGHGGDLSIARVYTFTNPISFTGALRLFYSDGELNGNSEPLLEMAYLDPSVDWITTTASTVDALNNSVTYNFNAVTFQSITATAAGNILPLADNSFKGNLSSNAVELSWKVSENDLYRYFEVQFTDDNDVWTTAGTVFPLAASELRTYTFSHPGLQFTRRFYRLKLVRLSGQVSYSPVISFNHTVNTGMSVFASKGGLKARFNGWQPQRIVVIDQLGRILQTASPSQAIWEINGLPPGIYLLLASDTKTNMTRKIFVY